MAKVLTAQDILNLPDKIAIKESSLLGGSVYVKKPSIRDREKIALFFESAKGSKNGAIRASEFYALMIELCIVDETGKPLFEADEVMQLKEKSEEYFLELRNLIDAENKLPTKENVEQVKESLEQTQ